jgi:hypothetical protein
MKGHNIEDEDLANEEFDNKIEYWKVPPYEKSILGFERIQNGKKKRFTAKCDWKTKKISFRGELHHPIEVEELIEFLGLVNNRLKRETGIESEESDCKCEPRNSHAIEKGIFYIGPEFGQQFDLIRCNSCGKISRRVTVYY